MTDEIQLAQDILIEHLRVHLSRLIRDTTVLMAAVNARTALLPEGERQKWQEHVYGPCRRLLATIEEIERELTQ